LNILWSFLYNIFCLHMEECVCRKIFNVFNYSRSYGWYQLAGQINALSVLHYLNASILVVV
jgi:hypothetical protein